MSATGDVLDHSLRLTRLEDAPLAQRLSEVVGDVADSHANMQMPVNLEDTLGIIDHPPDSQIQAVQVGTRGQAQGVKDVHDAQFTG